MTVGLSRIQIQICRAFGILLVVLHHTINNTQISGGWLLEFAHADVVFFFFISGYLYERNREKYCSDSRGFLRKKAKQLIVPYLFWTLILYFVVSVVHMVFGNVVGNTLNSLGFPRLSIKDIVLNTVFFKDYYVQHLWYIYVLFFFFLISIALRKCDQILVNVYTVGALLLAASYAVYIKDLPYILNKFLRYYPDFMIGRLLFRTGFLGTSKKSRRNGIWGITGVLVTILFFNCIRPMMPKTLFRASLVIIIQDLLYWSVVVLGVELSRIIQNTEIGKRLAMIGDFSFDIYLMHTPYIVPIIAALLSKMHLNFEVICVVTISLGISVPIVISKYVVRRNIFLSNIMLGR